MNNKKKSSAATGEYGRVVKFLGLLGGAQVLALLMNLLRNKLSSKILGTIGFGFIGLYSRTVQMFSDFTNLSLSYSAVRKLSEVYENSSSQEVEHYVKVTRSLALLTGIVGMLLFMVFSPFVMSAVSDGTEFSVWYLLLLSPTVLFMAVSGGELAVMRGVRRINSLAIYTLWTAFSGLLVALPMYYFMGVAGILPSILLIAFLQMAGVLFHTIKLFGYKVAPFSMRLLRDGADMIKLGAGYIYTTMLVSFTAWAIYTMVSDIGGDSELGLFSSGYLLLSMLPSVLFAASDSEYYPRLSGAFGDLKVRNAMVNEQIEVHSLVQTPVILSVVLLLPFLMPLLYTNEYAPAVVMTQIAMFGLLFHVLTYPMSFMALSKGDVMVFILQETVFNVVNMLLIFVGYSKWGLAGAGVALLLARIIDFAVSFSVTYFRYGFRLSYCSKKYFVLNMVLAMLLFCAQFYMHGIMMWVFSLLSVGCSIALSVYFLARYGDVFNKILKRLKLKR